MSKLRIIKSFHSNEYAISMHNRYIERSSIRQTETIASPDNKPFLEWGLSSDGNLCCRGAFKYCNYPEWTEYESCVFNISLTEMQKIVKEFGHLLVFI